MTDRTEADPLGDDPAHDDRDGTVALVDAPSVTEDELVVERRTGAATRSGSACRRRAAAVAARAHRAPDRASADGVGAAPVADGAHRARSRSPRLSLFITTYVMLNVVHLNPLNPSADLVLDRTTPTGGDMGAHVWGPAFLRDYLLPNWQLNGWSMDWYAGMPTYRFYMVVPALGMVALDTLLPYGVAFKLVAVAGLVTLPFCCWAFGRLARFRYPMPELFAFAGLAFALDESFSIYGGNLKSTMAGEFSFSIALSLMVLGFGLLVRSMETGRFRCWTAIVLALAIVSHGIVAIYTVLGAAVIVVVVVLGRHSRRKRLVHGLSIGGRSSCCRRGGSGRSSATTST